MDPITQQPNTDRVRPALVPRPGEFGVDLPAGKSAADLETDDYRVVEIVPEDDPSATRH